MLTATKLHLEMGIPEGQKIICAGNCPSISATLSWSDSEPKLFTAASSPNI
jgi:hypothetical protein